MRSLLQALAWIGKVAVESIFFALIVGFLLIHAENTIKVREDALNLMSQADYVARKGIDPSFGWATDDRRADAYVAMDNALVNLRTRLPDNVFFCLADAVGTAKKAHFQTIRNPADSIKKMEGRYAIARESVKDWYVVKMFTLGFTWNVEKTICE